MPGNRVEELEQTVTELESTVSGLTEELVETKERIRDLEAELEPQPADGSAIPEANPEEVREAVAQAEFDEEAAQAAAREDVEGFDAESGDETDTPEEAEAEAEDGDDSEFGDDIIVA